MGREGKNRPLARAGRLAWSPPTGRRAPGLADYTGGLFLFGNERAAALGVPRTYEKSHRWRARTKGAPLLLDKRRFSLRGYKTTEVAQGAD